MNPSASLAAVHLPAPLLGDVRVLPPRGLNTSWYLDVNNFSRQTSWAHGFMHAYALWLGPALLAAAFLVLYAVAWWRRAPRATALLVLGGIGTLVALGLNQLVGHAAGELRPYATHPQALVLVGKTNDYSFPSDHSIVAGGLTMSLLLVTGAAIWRRGAGRRDARGPGGAAAGPAFGCRCPRRRQRRARPVPVLCTRVRRSALPGRRRGRLFALLARRRARVAAPAARLPSRRRPRANRAGRARATSPAVASWLTRTAVASWRHSLRCPCAHLRLLSGVPGVASGVLPRWGGGSRAQAASDLRNGSRVTISIADNARESRTTTRPRCVRQRPGAGALDPVRDCRRTGLSPVRPAGRHGPPLGRGRPRRRSLSGGARRREVDEVDDPRRSVAPGPLGNEDRHGPRPRLPLS